MTYGMSNRKWFVVFAWHDWFNKIFHVAPTSLLNVLVFVFTVIDCPFHVLVRAEIKKLILWQCHANRNQIWQYNSTAENCRYVSCIWELLTCHKIRPCMTMKVYLNDIMYGKSTHNWIMRVDRFGQNRSKTVTYNSETESHNCIMVCYSGSHRSCFECEEI